MAKKSLKIWASVIILVVLIAAIVLFLVLGQDKNKTDLIIIKDQMVIPQDKCSQLDQYSIIYQTGCPHCAKVLPRILEVEQSLGITFKHYNLAIQSDFNKIQTMGIMPEGVPAVIINCKAYLGDGYSTEEFRSFILGN